VSLPDGVVQVNHANSCSAATDLPGLTTVRRRKVVALDADHVAESSAVSGIRALETNREGVAMLMTR
jgi:hypothetical protein